MLNKPQFQPHYHIEVVEDNQVFLLGEESSLVLIGEIYVLLAPLLDGEHTVDEIINKLKSFVSVLSIYRTLSSLENQGYIIESTKNFSPANTAFWSSQGIDPIFAINKLRNTKVSLTCFGEFELQPLIASLSSFGIELGEEENFTIVLTDDYLRPELKSFNEDSIANKKPWLLVKLVGQKIWIGPLFSSDKTGCWQCLAHRLKYNRPVATSISMRNGSSISFPTSKSSLTCHYNVGVNLVASEIAKWVVRGINDKLLNNIVTLNLASLDIDNHQLVKRQQCKACGEISNSKFVEPKPVILQSHLKKYTHDGGHRAFKPEETFEKYKHLISPITGVIRELKKRNHGSDHIQVYTAEHSIGDNLGSFKNLKNHLNKKSAGKGKTDQQSKASALCEAIERYSTIFTGDETLIKGKYSQIEGAIHPHEFLLFSSSQYQKRIQWNSEHCSFAQIYPPFDEKHEISWAPVWSLTQKKFKYIPADYCYFSYQKRKKSSFFCSADTNGNSAGNSLEEAILQGFMELVERDCVALWWYNCAKRPAVDLQSFDEPYLSSLQDFYELQQREFWVLDITNDFNIPCFVAISRHTQDELQQITLGMGCHFDPKIAILRAVTELNQTYGINIKHKKSTPKNQDWKRWLEEATIENQPYLVGDITQPRKVLTDYPQKYREDLRDDIYACIEIAEKQGLEVLVLDLTRPDIGLNVVKVIAPGMRHFWCRLAPGRLYDVPVKLGWIPKKLTEDQLNPIPFFF